MSNETSESREESTQDHHHVGDLLGGYALGALEPADTERVARHIQACQACQAELAAYTHVVGLLPYAAAPLQVPVRARAGLLARLDEIEAERQARLRVVPTPTRGERLRSWWQGLSTTKRAAAFAAMPAVITLIVVGVMAGIINNQQQELDSIEADQIELSNVLVGSDDDPGAQATFVSSRSASEARAKLIVNHETNSALILAVDLPQPADDEQYVVWLQWMDRSEVARVAVLEVEEDGRAQLQIKPRGSIDDYDSVVITLERDPEAATPSGPEIMSAALVRGR